MASIAFKPRTSFMIVGASGSGKTYWVYKFLHHLPDMFQDPAPEKILYCYGIYQPLFDDMKQNIPHLIFHQGLPDKEEMEQFAGHTLLVLDDLMSDVSNSKPMQDLFCQYCHHMGISVMYLTQNLFHQGKCARTIALNTHVLVLMKSMRNASQVSCVARQLYPGQAGMLEEIYQDAMREPYGYLVIDMSPHAQDEYRLRSKIFPGEDPIIYIPRKV